MARTPLFRLLRRAARIARASLHQPMPLDEFHGRGLELRAEAAARRRFLAGGGAIAGLALAGCATSPRPPAAGGHDEFPVAIVGGGIAGLTAAWRLRQAGVQARVYEAQERFGGRMLSLRGHFADDQVVELGGELIDTGHVRIRKLAAEMGVELDDLLDGDDDHEAWFFDGRAIDEKALVEAFQPVAAAVERDLALLGEDMLDYRGESPATFVHAQRLDRMSIAQWLDAESVSGWLRSLLDVAYTTEMGLEIAEQSALNLLTFIGTDTSEGFEIFGDSDERFHVRGGNDLIVQKVAAKVADSLHNGHVLEAIRGEGDGYVLSFRQGQGSREVRAKQVLLALPFTLLRQVRIDVPLPAHKRRAIDGLKYGTNAKLMIGFSSRPWRTHGANGASMSDLAYQTSWETSRKQAGKAGILTNFTGGRHGVAIGQGTPADQAKAAVANLERVFPGAAAARAGMREARFHWPSNPWVLGSYACLGPGDWTTLRGAIEDSVGGLFFAGEHCAPEAQGFMEGGVESGELAAEAILASRGMQPVTSARLRGAWARAAA